MRQKSILCPKIQFWWQLAKTLLWIFALKYTYFFTVRISERLNFRAKINFAKKQNFTFSLLITKKIESYLIILARKFKYLNGMNLIYAKRHVFVSMLKRFKITSICLKSDWQFGGWGTSGLICTVKCEKTPWWTTNEFTLWIQIQLKKMPTNHFMTLLRSKHNWKSEVLPKGKRQIIDEQCENLASLASNPKIISAILRC